MSTTGLGTQSRITHLVEKSIRVVRPRDARKLDVEDLLGKPFVIVRDRGAIDGRQRCRCGTNIDREEITALNKDSKSARSQRRRTVKLKLTEREMP